MESRGTRDGEGDIGIERVGREGVVVTEYRRRCRVVVAAADADADADVGVVVEFDSCYLVGYCDV